MLNKSINERYRSVFVLVVRQLSSRLNANLGDQMKMLNEKKRFTEALHLFDECRTNDTKPLPNMIIMQALKASTNLRDLQRGIGIHQLVSGRVKNDSYIAASLIHLYSEFALAHLCRTFQCCSAMRRGPTRRSLIPRVTRQSRVHVWRDDEG